MIPFRYWSISTLTLSQNYEAKPVSKEDYIFLSSQIVFALLLFATIMGQVASIVSNLSNARKDFQGNGRDGRDDELIKDLPFSQTRCGENLYVLETCASESRRSCHSMVSSLENSTRIIVIVVISGSITFGSVINQWMIIMSFRYYPINYEQRLPFMCTWIR